jgi:hypothetical protein
MSHLTTPQMLCTGCRVQPSTTVVGAYPVCSNCSRDVVGFDWGWIYAPWATAITNAPSAADAAAQYGAQSITQQQQSATSNVQSTVDVQANVAQQKLDIAQAQVAMIEKIAIGIGAIVLIWFGYSVYKGSK